MSYATIDDLRSQLGAPVTNAQTPEYRAKMLHPIPPAREVNREAFILERCTAKRVVEFGASGQLHDGIVRVARAWTGFDRVASVGIFGIDLDDVALGDFPEWGVADVIVCGETLEHLANPGHFMARLRTQSTGVPIIITVPNAFTAVAQRHLQRGYENVNLDHVAWYSPTTLTSLLKRYQFPVNEFYWYGGNGPTAQGLVVVTE